MGTYMGTYIHVGFVGITIQEVGSDSFGRYIFRVLEIDKVE